MGRLTQSIRITRCCGLLTISALISGCVGVNTTLFFTKTNRGVEFSSIPPSAAVDVARSEGVITPQFENGKILPVLASFKAESSGLFAGGVGSTFATGAAAATLAKNYDMAGIGSAASGKLTLSKMPIKKSARKKASTDDTDLVDFQQDDVRPVVFGTKTSVGLKLGWSTLTATLPDSFTFGYNRKELAIVPITYEAGSATTPDCDTGKFCMNQASLLATLENTYVVEPAVADATGEDGFKEIYLQYFATGQAATDLARQPEVRVAMLKRLDPNESVSITPRRLPVFASLLDMLEEEAENDPGAAALVDNLAQQRFQLPDSFPSGGLKHYDGKDPTLVALSNNTLPMNDKDIDDVIAFVAELNDSIRAAGAALQLIENAKANNTAVKFQNTDNDGDRVPTDDDRNGIIADIKALQQVLLQVQQEFSRNQVVIDAYQYASGLLNTGG